MAGTQFILYGDSRTSSSGLNWKTPVGGSASTGAYGYAGWLSAYSGGAALVPSNGDYAITGGGQPWQVQIQDILNSPVQNVIVMLGHNWAAYSNTPPPTAALDEAAIQTILDKLTDGGKQVFLVTELPITGFNSVLYDIHQWETDPNGASAGNPAIHVIDLWDQFVDPANPSGNSINPALVYDGLHLNAAGSQLFAKGVLDGIAPYLTGGDGIYLPTSSSDSFDPVSNPDGVLIKNFMLQGAGGTVGAGTTGQVATGWSSSVRNTDGLTVQLSKATDANGIDEQVVHITGTPTQAGGSLTLQVVTNVSGVPIGDTLRGAVVVDYPSSSTGILNISPTVFMRFANGSQAITRGLAGSQYPITSGFDMPFVIPDLVMTANLTQITYNIIVSFAANTPVDATLTFSQAEIRDITRAPDAVSQPVVLADTAFQDTMNKSLTIAPSDLLAHAIDPLGNAMTVTGANSAIGGTVSLVNGQVVFVPTTGFTGAASFQFIVTDSTGGSAVGHANITVAAAAYGAAGTDFNDDGIGDVLFTSSANAVAFWELGSTGAISASGTFGSLGTSAVIGTGDFDGDGSSDLLLRDPAGMLSVWTISGTGRTGVGTIGNPGPTLTALGTGDFNGDGKADILFRNGLTGDFSTWDMSLNTVIGGGTIGNPGANWVYKATGDFNGDGKSDLLFLNADGSYGVWALNDFTVIGGGAVADPGANWFFKGTGDFNGDGKSDILFENADGTYAIWDLNGTAIIGGGQVGNPGPGWTLVGTGDYNGDGKTDLLFENTSGAVVVWALNDTAIGSSYTISGSAANLTAFTGAAPDFAHLVFQDSSTGAISGWQIGLDQQVGAGTLGTPAAGLTAIATGDFAGTGETDVLFTDGAGTLSYWSSNGIEKLGGATIGALPAGATFLAVADFNGDKHSDVLFQNSDGSLATWDLSGSQHVGGGTIGSAAGYAFAATGDFNGDGKSDILFRNIATGDLAIWLMNDTTITGGGFPGNPGGTWQIKGTGDFNGDGKSDILFEDAGGNYAIWDMNGASVIGGGAIGNPGGGYTLAKIVDLNQDGKSDLLFVDSSGHYAAWLMNDTAIIGGGLTLGTGSSNLHLI